MTDHFDDDNHEENEKSFAEMLDAYSPGTDAEVGIGDKIRGKIVSIGRDSVFVDFLVPLHGYGYCHRDESVFCATYPAGSV